MMDWVRGAEGAGIDASKRLVAVARDRNPGADIRVGDRHALAWDNDSVDVATSFRGIRGTTPNQAAMVSLGRPGTGEELLARWGFVDIERVDVPFVSEIADPDIFARALAPTGPAYEAIGNVGEAAAGLDARGHGVLDAGMP